MEVKTNNLTTELKSPIVGFFKTIISFLTVYSTLMYKEMAKGSMEDHHLIGREGIRPREARYS